VRTSVALRIFARGTDLLRPDVLRGTYLRLIAALFLFHFAQYFVIPLFPLRWVDELEFSDGAISLGTAAFFVAVLLGSLPFDRLTRAWGNRRLVAGGAALLSLYPLLTAVMTNLPLYLLTSFLGGLAWAFVGGALANHLLDNIPTGDRPAHLAWYNFALNGAILCGSLAGPVVADSIGLFNALVVGFFLRVIASAALWFGGAEQVNASTDGPSRAA
jgi:MFS family permease